MPSLLGCEGVSRNERAESVRKLHAIAVGIIRLNAWISLESPWFSNPSLSSPFPDREFNRGLSAECGNCLKFSVPMSVASASSSQWEAAHLNGPELCLFSGGHVLMHLRSSRCLFGKPTVRAFDGSLLFVGCMLEQRTIFFIWWCLTAYKVANGPLYSGSRVPKG